MNQKLLKVQYTFPYARKLSLAAVKQYNTILNAEIDSLLSVS